MISSRRSTWAVSSSRHWSPVATVIPSTSTCGERINRSTACMLVPPGPEQSSSMMTLRLGCWPHARGPASSTSVTARAKLKRKFESSLYHAWIIHRGVNHAKSSRRVEIRRRRSELRMVEQVEELRSKVQLHAFTRKQKVLDH